MQEEDDAANELDELNRDLGQLNFMQEPADEAVVDDNDDEDSFVDDEDVLELPASRKHAKVLKERANEEKEFEDEVEYDPQTQLRERFRKFRHLPSFVDNEWNKYVS